MNTPGRDFGVSTYLLHTYFHDQLFWLDLLSNLKQGTTGLSELDIQFNTYLRFLLEISKHMAQNALKYPDMHISGKNEFAQSVQSVINAIWMRSRIHKLERARVVSEKIMRRKIYRYSKSIVTREEQNSYNIEYEKDLKELGIICSDLGGDQDPVPGNRNGVDS